MVYLSVGWRGGGGHLCPCRQYTDSLVPHLLCLRLCLRAWAVLCFFSLSMCSAFALPWWCPYRPTRLYAPGAGGAAPQAARAALNAHAPRRGPCCFPLFSFPPRPLFLCVLPTPCRWLWRIGSGSAPNAARVGGGGRPCPSGKWFPGTPLSPFLSGRRWARSGLIGSLPAPGWTGVHLPNPTQPLRSLERTRDKSSRWGFRGGAGSRVTCPRRAGHRSNEGHCRRESRRTQCVIVHVLNVDHFSWREKSDAP